MILSTTNSYLDDKLSVKEAVKMFKDAGFDAFDISLSHLYFNEKMPIEWSCENYKDLALEIRKFADDIGIVCNQAHAPYPTSFGNREEDDKIFTEIVKSMEIASILGAKIIVVHPKHHLEYAKFADELYEMNVEFYKSLIPYCEKFNIKVATENMWQWDDVNKKIIDSVCSRPQEFCNLIDDVDSEWVVGCLDIGHTKLVNVDIGDFIRTLGKNRLKALHVHDVDGKSDLHTMPFIANIDFDSFCKALSDIDYDGDFTFEACSYLHKLPLELRFSGCKMLHDIGRYLINKID